MLPPLARLAIESYSDPGALRNLSGEMIKLCEAADLRYWQRIIGLPATIHESELVMRPSLWQVLNVRRACALGERTQVVAHEDVLVFRKHYPRIAQPSCAQEAA